MSSDGKPGAAETSTLDQENPFLGLEPFREVDAAWFHGRDQDEEALAQLLRRTGPAVVYGASGLGKTSLLRAGLFPRLREQGMLPVYIRLVHQARLSDPLAQIRSRIAAEIDASGVDAEPPPDGMTLWEYFHRTPFWDERNRLLTPVLVFDQFEEIFTVGRTVDGRATLIEELTDLIENHIPAPVRRRVEAGEAELPGSYERPKVKVVLSLREDFLPDLASLQAVIPSLRHNHYRLRPMSGTAAVRAVLGPGAHIVDERVAGDIVRFVASAGVHASGEEAAEGELGLLKVEPSLLSLVCRELNERRIRMGAKRITAELLAGSRETILRDFYQRTTRDLGPQVRAFIEDKLLTARGFRTTVALQSALDEPGITDAVIGALVDRRLVRREERLGIPHVELVHDVMTRFVAESRDRRRAEAGELEEQAARWRRFKGYATIALVVLIALLGVAGSMAVRNLRQAEKVAKELLEQKELERSRTEAATRKSLSRLVETLSRLAGADLARGERAAAVGRLALARAASGALTIDSPVRTWIEARTFAALETLVAQRASLGNRVSRLAVSPGGERVLLIGADGGARVATPTATGLHDGAVFFAQSHDVEAAAEGPQAQRMPVRERERAPRAQARVVQGAWAGDGESVILLDDTGRIVRWGGSDDAGSGLGTVAPGAEQVVVDVSGRTVVVRGPNGGGGVVSVVRERGADSGERAPALSRVMGDMAALALDERGRRVAIASRARKAVVLLEIGDGLTERVVALGVEPSAIVMSADGAEIVVGDMQGGLTAITAGDGRATALDLHFDSPILGLAADRALAQVLVRPKAGPVVSMGRAAADASHWQVIARYSGHRGKVRHAGTGGAAGELVVTSSSADGTVRVWEAGTGRLSDLHAHEGTDVMAWLMRDGRTLLSLSGDGTLRVWDRDAEAVGSEGRALSQGAPQLDGSVDGARVGVHARAGTVAPAFSVDGRFLATLGSDGTLVRWRRDGAGWARDQCARGLGGGAGLNFSEDGRRLTYVAGDGAVCEWSPGAGGRPAAPGGEQDCAGNMGCGPSAAAAARSAPAAQARWSLALGDSGRRLVEERDGELAILAADGRRERALLGHEGAIASLAVTPDGRRGLSGSADGSVRLWDLERGRTVARWGGGTRGAAVAAFSSDGREIALILPGGEVWVVAAPTADSDAPVARGRVCKLGHTAPVEALTFNQSGARLATAGADGCVIQHALLSDVDLPELSLDEPVRGVRYLRHEGLLTDGRTPRIYDANSGQLRATLAPPDGGDTRFVRVSARDERIVSVDGRGGVAVWEVARPGTGQTGARVESTWRLPVAGRAGLVTAIGASVAGGRYGLGDEAGGVRVITLGDGAADVVLPMPEGPVRALDFDDKGERLLVLTEAAARVVSLDAPAQPVSLPGARGVAGDLALDGRSAIIARDDGGVEIWTVGPAPQRVYWGALGVEEVSFAADAPGRALGWSAHSTAVFVFSAVADGSFEITRLDLAQGALAAALSPDGLGVAISSVQTLTLSTGDLRQPVTTHDLGGDRFAYALSFAGATTLVAGLGGEGAAAFALPDWQPVAGPARVATWVLRADPRGRRVASLGGEVAAVWTPGSPAPAQELVHDGGLPIDLAFGPGPDRVVTLTEAGAAHVWRLDASAAPEATHFPVTLVDAAWTPMGPRVVTVSQDARLQVWAASSADRPVIDREMGGGFRVSAAAVSPSELGIALGSTTGEVAYAMLLGETAPVFATDAVGGRASHGRPVTAIALSSARIASASAEGDLRIWSTDGKVVAQHALQGEEVSALAFGADGQMLLVSSSSGLVRAYDAEVGEPLFVVDTGLDVAGPVALDRDASRLATASGDGRVRLWPLALPRRTVDGLLDILAPPR